MIHKRTLALVVALGLMGLALNLAPAARAAGTTIAVAPGQSIQAALDRAQPGDTIRLQDGLYREDLHSVRDGRADAPITIIGSERVVLSGAGAARLFEINHSYLALDGFTIDGKRGSSASDKLVYVLGKRVRTPLLGLVIRNMHIGNAGGECVRLRYYVQRADIANTTIGPCGLVDFPNGKWGGGGKNGEGIYIGTAPEQRSDGKNPDASPDLSNANHIHGNTIDTEGNECVDIKEAASANLVEGNRCTGQHDPNSGGFDSRGDGTIFRFNEVWGSAGAGIRLGGDNASDGTANQVYGNQLHDNAGGGVKVQRDPQAAICGNVLANNGLGASVGTFGSRYNPTATCPFPIDQPPTSTPLPTDEPLPPVPTVPLTRTPRPTPPSGDGGASFTGAPLRIEAEAASHLDGGLKVVKDLSRSGGGYLTSDGAGKVERPSEQGARYDLRIGSDVRAPVYVWVLGSGPAVDQDSVYLRFLGGRKVTVHLGREWGWKRVRLALEGKPSALELLPREYGARVDALVLTTDENYRPQDAR